VLFSQKGKKQNRNEAKIFSPLRSLFYPQNITFFFFFFFFFFSLLLLSSISENKW